MKAEKVSRSKFRRVFLKIELDESVAAASATSFCKQYRSRHALTCAKPVDSAKLAQISALQDVQLILQSQNDPGDELDG